MKPKPIGVIGGAGPSAGVFFLDRLFSLARRKYGCHRDADFPQVFLLSFPFSEMLESSLNVGILQKELRNCLCQLRQNGSDVLAIACNTLHAFLDPQDDQQDFMHLPRILGKNIGHNQESPLVLCTSTASKDGLHRRFFNCEYADSLTQREVDEIIDEILKGDDPSCPLEKLSRLIERQVAKTVILGCTELSLFASQLSIKNKTVIDPLDLLAEEVLKTSFRSLR